MLGLALTVWRVMLLATPEHCETWLKGTPTEAFALARSFPAEAMRIVQSGIEKKDLLS